MLDGVEVAVLGVALVLGEPDVGHEAAVFEKDVLDCPDPVQLDGS